MFSAPDAATLASRTVGIIGAAGVLLIGALAFQGRLPPASPAIAPLTGGGERPCSLQPGSYLRGRFFGAINLQADWSGEGLVCDGMQKPEGQGVRLFFAGEQQGGGRLSVVIGIDGHPDTLAGTEHPANVTVIDELESRFFSTSGAGRCWTIISSVTPLARSRDHRDGYRINGTLYCLGALPSLSDRTSLTLGDVRFAGQVYTDEA